MAFPKTQSGSDLMLGAPSPIDPAQLDELGLRLAKGAKAADQSSGEGSEGS
jgi:aspartyl-tRNA synthetase